MRTKVVSSTVIFGSSYFQQAFGDADELISNAETQLNGLKIEFDSMVGIGLSGLLVLPLLARHFDVPFLALRKPGVDSHDSPGEGQYGRGRIGKRWILIDDFVSTGNTVEVAKARVSAGIARHNCEFLTTYVGTYCYGTAYGKACGRFVYPNSNTKSVMAIRVDGKPIYVDFDTFARVKIQVYKNRYSTDPKGRAITYIRTNTYSPINLDELATIAVEAEKQIKSGDLSWIR